MKSILGTIALEPNRWTGRRNPRYTLQELLPAVREAGFNQLEAWQWHVSGRYLKDIREIRALADSLGVTFPYIGVYPSFVLEGPDGREEERLQADILDKAEILGTPALKIMLGTGLKGSDLTPALEARTVDRFGAWQAAARARGITMAAELHGNTLFDPVEAGLAFMARHPELDFSICYQPYDFFDPAKALSLADQFAGRISHMHLQAPQRNETDGRFGLLENSPLDYPTLIPSILRRNPDATMTLEFVKDCTRPCDTFNLSLVLQNARRDALFVDGILASIPG
jgi:sugar phosphate isomerase/epimerase